jgi:hypothetical protein
MIQQLHAAAATRPGTDELETAAAAKTDELQLVAVQHGLRLSNAGGSNANSVQLMPDSANPNKWTTSQQLSYGSIPYESTGIQGRDSTKLCSMCVYTNVRFCIRFSVRFACKSDTRTILCPISSPTQINFTNILEIGRHILTATGLRIGCNKIARVDA